MTFLSLCSSFNLELKNGSLGKETVAAYSGKNSNMTKLTSFAYWLVIIEGDCEWGEKSHPLYKLTTSCTVGLCKWINTWESPKEATELWEIVEY